MKKPAKKQQGHEYHIQAGGLRVTWDEKRFTWAAQRGRRCWECAEPEPDALKVRAPKSMAIAMRSARRVKTTPFENGALVGVVCEAADFAGLPGTSRLSLTLVLAIEKTTGELVAQVDGETEGLFFEHLCWPGPVLFKRAAEQETVLPFNQGTVIPGNWPQAMARKEHLVYDRVLYMPWWGQRAGAAGYMAILETDADAGCRFEHPAGGPTRMGPWWPGSLGRIAYPRSIRYSFFDRCDYMSLCKHYRRYVMGTGKFVSMREKIAATPKVERLIGSPVIHTGVAHTIHPKSPFWQERRSREAVPAAVSRRGEGPAGTSRARRGPRLSSSRRLGRRGLRQSSSGLSAALPRGWRLGRACATWRTPAPTWGICLLCTTSIATTITTPRRSIPSMPSATRTGRSPTTRGGTAVRSRSSARGSPRPTCGAITRPCASTASGWTAPISTCSPSCRRRSVSIRRIA